MSDQVTAGGANSVTVIPADRGGEPAKPATSGPTHAQSGPNGPDPTGLRASLEKNLAAAAQKAVGETNATKKPAASDTKPADAAVSRETSTDGRARGPDGKFLAADAGADAATKPGQAAGAADAAAPAAVRMQAPPSFLNPYSRLMGGRP